MARHRCHGAGDARVLRHLTAIACVSLIHIARRPPPSCSARAGQYRAEATKCNAQVSNAETRHPRHLGPHDRQRGVAKQHAARELDVVRRGDRRPDHLQVSRHTLQWRHAARQHLHDDDRRKRQQRELRLSSRLGLKKERTVNSIGAVDFELRAAMNWLILRLSFDWT
jgi:hypothetical protein